MSLTADCLARLKLRQAPFEAIPSEEFLYSDPLLESLIETAARALAAPGAIVILAGADGSGRSIQLMRLLGVLGDHFELIAFRGRHHIAFDAIDVTIRNHLRASGFDAPARTLDELLTERSRAGLPIVLAIDDAHLLGQEIVRRLLRLRAEILEARGQGMRLILVGDQTLNRGRLPLPDPADEGQIVRLNLRPFNPEQAGAYLRHRLRVAGIDDPEAFLSAGDIATLQTNSLGLPAALNANANAWLARRCHSVGGFRQAIVGRIGSLVKPAGVMTAGEQEVKAAAAPAMEKVASNNPVGILDAEAEDEIFRPTVPHLADFLVQEDARSETYDFEQVLRHVRNSKLILEESPPPVERQPEPVASAPPVPDWSRRWFMPTILSVVILSILVPVVWQLASRSPSPDLDSLERPEIMARPDQASGQESLVASVGQPPPIPQSEVNPVESDGAASAVPPDQAVAVIPVAPSGETPTPNPPPEPEPQSVEPPAPVVEDPAEGQAWLMRQNASRFTIQLIAARDPATTRAFVARHQLSGIHYIQTRSFMIAVIGSFPSRAEAERALPDLPAAVREKEPWIRTIGSIRESQR